MKHVIHLEFTIKKEGAELRSEAYTENGKKREVLSIERAIGMLELAKLQAFADTKQIRPTPTRRTGTTRGNA